MKEKISILCPTRGRPQNIKSLLNSAKDTASNFENLEFVFYIDNDDLESTDTIYGLPFENVKIIKGERIVLSEMWNKCYEIATGKIFMHCGDDIVFGSKGWDSKVQEAFSSYPDRIAVVYGNDGFHGEALSTHGFLHRNWIRTVGYLCPPYFSSDWNDRWLFDIAKAINRTRYLPDVSTEHMHPAAGKGEYDKTHKERMERGKRDKVEELFHSKKMIDKRNIDARKLAAFVQSFEILSNLQFTSWVLAE